MASSATLSAVPPLPDDVLASLRTEAERDAVHVGAFLNELGYRGTPAKPLRVPAAFLINLGAALRLLLWEHGGHRVHLDAGLPPAQEAIAQVFLSLLDSARLPSDFALQVFRLLLNRFAWQGRRDLDADVVLDFLTDEAALDALAEFLWTHRHEGPLAGVADRGMA